MPKLSFSISANGFPAVFFDADAFFCFGGVSARSDSSSSSGSSSISMSEFSSLTTFFFGAAFAFGLAAAPAGRPLGFAGAAAFFGAALGFVTFAAFAGGAKSELAPSPKSESSMIESLMADNGQLQSPASRGCRVKGEKSAQTWAG
jgi:hypothetical protein